MFGSSPCPRNTKQKTKGKGRGRRSSPEGSAITAITSSFYIRRGRGRRGTLAWTRTTRSGARGLLVDSMACAVAVRFVDEVGVEEDDAEAAARSRRAMELCTRGAKAVAEVFLERIATLFSPLRRERSWRNTLAWTRTTRSGARSFGVALGIISRPKKCLFDPGLNLMESLREINKVATISAECARGRTLRFLFSKPVLFALMV